MTVLNERFWAKVEKTDTCWNWTAAKTSGYGRVRANGRMQVAHRVSYEDAKGLVPEGMHLDHMCYNRSCVNPDHLRVTTYKENNENRSGPRAGSKSGVRGVSWHKRYNKWHAQVTHNRQKIHVGLFDTIAEAGEAVMAKRLELFTHNDIDRKVA